jgi:hypothetical protein
MDFKKIITILAGVLSAVSLAFAQSSGTLTLVLTDSSNGDAVGFATVSLTKQGASKAYKYVLSDANGKAVIEKVASGKYTVKAELMGYKPLTQQIEMKGNKDLGTLKMDPDRQVLDAASVSATGNPIVIKKDTIEYNASSFKTTDNDMLEDLLKKLPGVEVSEDGTVTANGQTISKITIDGKTFFLDDPQLASKNIPAKIIDKVKVVDKKSEQAEFTGIDDGNNETVLDLSIQKGMMNGLFGNVMAGAGHDVRKAAAGSTLSTGDGDWRYQGAGFLGRFTDKNQLSVIVNGNNTNNRGFNDLAGSMMQGMRGGGGGMGRGSRGWGQGNGITTSWMAGLNGNVDLFDDKMELGGNYLYNNNETYVEENSIKKTYLDDYNLIYNNNGSSTTSSDGHRFGVRLEHKFSENTSILFQPQVSFGKGDFLEFSDFETLTERNGNTSRTNEGFTNSTGSNSNWKTNGFFLFRQKLGKAGRTLSFNIRYNFSGNETNGFNQSLTSTFDEFDIQSDSIINQRYVQNQSTNSLTGRLTYTEPLGKGFFIEANYEASYNKTTSTKNTFDSGNVDVFTKDSYLYNPTGELRNDLYSSEIINRYVNQSIGGNFVYQKDKLRAQVGVSANPTDTHNETSGYDTYDSHVLNWAPQAMLWYDIDDNTNVRGFYFGRSQQPSVSQLMKVPDNTNPLSVSFGNMYLLPYFNHDIRTEFRHTNKETYMSINAGIDGGIVEDPIVNAQWYGTNGVQYSIPVNGKDSYNGSLRVMLNTPIAKSNFSIFNMFRASYSKSSSYIGSSVDMSSYYDSENNVLDEEKFLEDFESLGFTLNNLQTVGLTERIRFTYRNDLVELTAGARTRMSKSWYTVANQSTNMTWSNMASASMNWTLPGGFGIVAEGNYNWYNGYTTEQDPQLILNAKITKLLFKEKFTLALNAYDILDQAQNLSISDSSNYHTETLNNTLGRYIIVSLTYRFGNFGGKGGHRGPGGGPGGRGPMGPPPGM